MNKQELLKMVEEIKARFDGKERMKDEFLEVKINSIRNGYAIRIQGVKTKGECGHTVIIHNGYAWGVKIYTILNKEQNEKRINEYLEYQNLV